MGGTSSTPTFPFPPFSLPFFSLSHPFPLLPPRRPRIPGFPFPRMIYKCAMCDTVFTHKPLLSSHFDQHLLPQRVSVFRCPQCPLLFAQKRTMLEHLKVSRDSSRECRDSGRNC